MRGCVLTVCAFTHRTCVYYTVYAIAMLVLFACRERAPVAAPLLRLLLEADTNDSKPRLVPVMC